MPVDLHFIDKDQKLYCNCCIRPSNHLKSIFQVKALYAFSGQGISIAKGEVMFLISKTNPDWWSVRKADRTDGFVPANYVREIEPRVVPVSILTEVRPSNKYPA